MLSLGEGERKNVFFFKVKERDVQLKRKGFIYLLQAKRKMLLYTINLLLRSFVDCSTLGWSVVYNCFIRYRKMGGGGGGNPGNSQNRKGW